MWSCMFFSLRSQRVLRLYLSSVRVLPARIHLYLSQMYHDSERKISSRSPTSGRPHVDDSD
jgi:hypothetical protein